MIGVVERGHWRAAESLGGERESSEGGIALRRGALEQHGKVAEKARM